MEKRISVIKVGDSSYPTNCYIIADKENKAIVIDPGLDGNLIIDKLKKENLDVKKIVLTHCHADHIGALDLVRNFTGASVLIHENDADGIIDSEKNCCSYLNIPAQKILKEDIVLVKDKDIINVGDISLEVYHTPGHTNGCICLYEKDLNALFTGDTIFYNCYGRCDLKSGSIDDMEKSIDRLFLAFDNVTIYPGHEEITNIDNVKKRIRLLFKIKNHK